MAALQLRRGLKANLPATAVVGEPLIATDTRELFIGTGTGTYKIGDVVFSDTTPTLEPEKIWVKTDTNQLYRADIVGGTWVALSSDLSGYFLKTDMATATDLGGLTPSDTKLPTQKAVKTYVDTVAAGLVIPKEWPDSVIDQLATPPVTPAEGDRYLVIATATGAWAGLENQIVEYKGTAWVPYVPTTGTFVSVDADATGLYYFGGTNWVKKSFELSTVGKGLTITSGKIEFDPTFAGSGLAWDPGTGILSVGTIDGGTF